MVESIKELIRPFIAVSTASTTLALFLWKGEVPTELLQLDGVVIAFYFAERAIKNNR